MVAGGWLHWLRVGGFRKRIGLFVGEDVCEEGVVTFRFVHPIGEASGETVLPFLDHVRSDGGIGGEDSGIFGAGTDHVGQRCLEVDVVLS